MQSFTRTQWALTFFINYSHYLETKENFNDILEKHVNEHGHLLHNAVHLGIGSTL